MNNWNGHERRSIDDTRDVAVRAESKVDQHMTDCTEFRRAMRETLNEFRADIKKLNWRIALLLGGIELAGKGIDWLLPAIRHLPIN